MEVDILYLYWNYIIDRNERIFVNNNYSEKNEVNNKIDKYLKKINKKLSSTEKIRKYILINQELTLKSGFLTPTMKIKRKKVYEKYKKDIDGLYS